MLEERHRANLRARKWWQMIRLRHYRRERDSKTGRDLSIRCRRLFTARRSRRGPDSGRGCGRYEARQSDRGCSGVGSRRDRGGRDDRKSKRLNSSHVKISYAVFCSKKKKKLALYRKYADITKKKECRIVYIRAT